MRLRFRDFMKSLQVCAGVLSLVVAGCNGSSKSAPPPPPTYSIGGTVAGLSVAGLVLSNGTDTVTVAANQTTFTFPTAVSSGTGYSIAVQTQPTGALCYLTMATGTVASANVSSIAVKCGSHNFWVLANGEDGTFDSAGSFGTLNVFSASNIPAARTAGSSFTDPSGNLWLFGGITGSSLGTATSATMNDLWRYSIAMRQWTWVGGQQMAGGQGTHAASGVASPSNQPSARSSAATWVDAMGNLWMYGGEGYDDSGAYNDLADLWMFDPSSSLWTWEGEFATGPGLRESATTWIDSAGTLWLFGGYDSLGNDVLQDLWSYSPQSGVWSFKSGSRTINAQGVYGVQGVAAAGNTPGARASATGRIDASGNLWLFGGLGIDGAGDGGILSDFWMYSPTRGEWTWVSGSASAQAQCTSDGVVCLSGATTDWFDTSNNVWSFGGSNKVQTIPASYFTEVSEFQSATGQATMLSVPAVSPMGRDSATGWTGTDGTFWMFGGYEQAGSVTPGGSFNDLWRYIP
jgi:N-acetylneuraminic acid mutarotase